MGEDSDPPKNPFIRWKQHVDTHIGLTLNGLLGIPSMVTKNLNIRKEADNEAGAGAADGTTTNSGLGGLPATSVSNAAPQQPAQPAQPAQANSNDYPSALPPAPPPTSHPPSDDDVLDGVDAAQLLEWHKFIYYSPYSPLKLQQQQHLHLLPPPVPQDVPFGADPYAFTYADAFEDLLRASSGRPLLDLADRSYRNLRYQMRYGSAVEPPYVFFHRMHSQRLLDAYFPRATAVGGATETSNTSDSPNDSVVRAVAALAERDRDLWREQLEEEEADKNYEEGADEDEFETSNTAHSCWGQEEDNAVPQLPGRRAGYGGSLFDELDRVFRVLGRIVDEDTGAAAAETKAASKMNGSANKPSVEDELYTAVRSAYADAEKSLSTLIKSFSNGFDSEDRVERRAAETAGQADDQKKEEGSQGETIQTTEEHVDAFGNRHVKTVVRRLDADGNEVSRETRHSIRSQPPQVAATKEIYDNDEQPESTEKTNTQNEAKREDNTKTTGWFWK